MPRYTDENGKKSYKLITVTNRINIADYATDYMELALKEKQIKAIGNGLMRPLKNTYVKSTWRYETLQIIG
jgi:peptidyl-prolyl cis-trans isomerase SurA